MRSEGVVTAAGSLLLSLALNGAAIWAVDAAARLRASRVETLLREKTPAADPEEALRFEFVEAPPKIHPETPADSRKIADRDALDQDASGADADGPPKAKDIGPSDQLAQNRLASAPPPAAAPEEPQKAQAAVPAESEETSASADPDGFVPAPPPQLPPQDAREEKGESGAPAQPSLTGRDRVTTEEMARTASVGARLRGMTSFEATGSGMGEYMKGLKEKIWLSWYPYLAFKYPLDFATADAILSITLDREGRVRAVRVVESRGSRVFSDFCLEAVQKAGPFGPLPQEILAILEKEELEILFAFHYM